MFIFGIKMENKAIIHSDIVIQSGRRNSLDEIMDLISTDLTAELPEITGSQVTRLLQRGSEEPVIININSDDDFQMETFLKVPPKIETKKKSKRKLPNDSSSEVKKRKSTGRRIGTQPKPLPVLCSVPRATSAVTPRPTIPSALPSTDPPAVLTSIPTAAPTAENLNSHVTKIKQILQGNIEREEANLQGIHQQDVDNTAGIENCDTVIKECQEEARLLEAQLRRVNERRAQVEVVKDQKLASREDNRRAIIEMEGVLADQKRKLETIVGLFSV